MKGVVSCVLIVPLPGIGTLDSAVSHFLFAKACPQPRKSLGIYSAQLFVMETLILAISPHETKCLGRQSGIHFFHLHFTRFSLLR